MERDFAIFKTLIEKMIDDNPNEYCRIQIPGYTANKLRGYFGIKADLDLIKSTFLEYCDPKLAINRPVYYYMIVILYGKCFTNASSASHPNLNQGVLEERKDLIDIHLELMESRHNFVAHRGRTNQDDAVVYFEFEKKNPTNFSVKTLRGKREHFIGDDPKKYVELFDRLIFVVDELIKKSTKKALKHLLNEFTHEQLLQMVIPSRGFDKIKL